MSSVANREIFEVWDYVVVAAMLAVSGFIGVYFRFSGGKQRTTSEYLMAGRDMAIFPVVLSLTATTQTAVGTLGFPGEVYSYGASLFWYPLGFLVALIICIFIYTPVYFDLRITSAYEYLEVRFGKPTRTIISALFIIQMVLFMSVGLYSPSIALSAVSGLSHLVSILTVGIVCAFYCTLGGMKAVLWTDVFQSVLMIFALWSVIIQGSLNLGGFSSMIEVAKEGKRLDFLNISTDPTVRFTILTCLIGGFMYGMTTSGGNQTQVQRLLTLRTLKRSQLALFFSIPVNMIFYYTIFMCGVVIYANFAGCDPLLLSEESGIKSADQLIPYFMIKTFINTPGMAGFCVSGVFCAALTSISSAVNSLAAVTVEDFVKPYCVRGSWLNDKKLALLSKFFAFFYSFLGIGMTYVVGTIKAIIPAAFVVFTAIGGPTIAIITLGMLTTSCNQKGILVGLLSGVALNAWIGAGALVNQYPQIKLPASVESCTETNSLGFGAYNNTITSILAKDIELEFSNKNVITEADKEMLFLYKLSFYLHPVPGTLLTLLVGYLVSLLTGGNKHTDLQLITPCLRRWFGKKLSTSEKTNGEAFQNGQPASITEVTEESKL